jgi:LacI family transcriptional regulator
MRSTITEIAEKAGVSHSTVSVVLNNRQGRRISLETQQRVLEVARQLNYTPDYLARGLKGGKTHTVGMLLAGLFEASTAKITSIERSASKNGYRVLSCYHDGNLDLEKRDIKELIARRVDGLIIFPVERTDGSHFRSLIEQQFPLVIMGKEFSFPMNVVGVDEAGIGLLAIQHMVQIGRKKIAFVGGGLASAALQYRLVGWKQGCREAGLDFNSLPFFFEDMKDDPGTFYQMTQALLDSRKPFDAIIATNDLCAIIVMKVLEKHGLKVPQDVAIIGLDNDRAGGYLHVPLTTIQHPLEELGKKAFQVLFNHIQNPSAPLDRIILEPELVIRESTVGGK